MDKHVSHNGSFLTAVLVFLCAIFWMPIIPAHAAEYQETIAKAFPGFKILN